MLRTIFYTTIENQVRSDGSFGLLYDHFTSVDQAYAKLYTILAAAAVSEIPYHAGFILRSDGVMMEGKVFDRRPISNPEPEPTPEPEE